jgi:hypothetical protein
MQKGRPAGSVIRDRITSLLAACGKLHGYELYQLYVAQFPTCTMRVIYYHLKKGVEYKVFKVHSVVDTTGNFSWGGVSQRTYYELEHSAKIPAISLNTHRLQVQLSELRAVR